MGVVASFVRATGGRSVAAMDPSVDDTSFETYLVERYWPGVDLGQLRAGLARLDETARAMTAEGSLVAHVGSILMPVDQVVFSLIAAKDEIARPAAQRARRPSRPPGRQGDRAPDVGARSDNEPHGGMT